MKITNMLIRIALTIAMIGAIAQAANYHVTLLKPSVVAGKELTPGDYDIALANDKIVISHGRTSVEAAVKTVIADRKYSSTTVRYELKDDKYKVMEIEVGGTKTKLVIDDEKASPGF